MSGQSACCMVMRINVDCNACCRKMRRILLNMKGIETHLIEKQHLRVSACGRFKPADVAIKIRKKMRRRVEILEIQELCQNDGYVEQQPQVAHHVVQNHHVLARGPPVYATTSYYNDMGKYVKSNTMPFGLCDV